MVGKELLKNMPDARLRFEKPESVVSEAIKSSKQPNQRRPMLPMSGTCSAGKTTQSIDEDEHLALDRILYNAYGDIAGLLRKVQVEHEFNGGRIGDKESDIILRNAQNVAIKEFLFNFYNQQPDALIEALSTLNLSSEIDNNQSIPVEQNSEVSVQSRVPETPHQMSSNVFNQSTQIADRYLSHPASPTVIANNMAERSYAMQTPISQSNSNSNIIQDMANSNTNYDDWSDDDFESSLALIPDVSPKNHSQPNERASGGQFSNRLSSTGSIRLNESIADDFRDAFNSNMEAGTQTDSNFTQTDDGRLGTPEQFSPFIFTQSDKSVYADDQAPPTSTFDSGEFESFRNYDREFGGMFNGKTIILKLTIIMFLHSIEFIPNFKQKHHWQQVFRQENDHIHQTVAFKAAIAK